MSHYYKESDIPKDIDRSESADAARLRWLMRGNGYLLENEGASGAKDGSEDDYIRYIIDSEMGAENE